MLGLRSGGVDLDQILRSHGVDLLAQHAGTVDALTNEGLVLQEGPLLRLTDKGFLLCDEITERLLLPVPAGTPVPAT
jgi:coproporphyrinogen III oxidase-like Fe-S oxidoreductase